MKSTHRAPSKPTAILCDCGMVLADFDRDLFRVGFRNHYGFEPNPKAIQWTLDEGPAFENGEWSVDAFWQEVQQRLSMPADDFLVFRKLWGDILQRNEDVITFFKHLASFPTVAFVMVSNIDDLRLDFTLNELGLNAIAKNVVASFHPDVDFKGPGVSTMWAKARRLAEKELGCKAETIIAVDDLPENMETALKEGVLTHAFCFKNLALLKAQLKEAGLFL